VKSLAIPGLPTPADLKAAAGRIAKFIHRTPVMTSTTLNEITGAEVFLKCENFQRIGAFKIRGALNTMFRMPREELFHGVATHSSGNHAQAVALAARLLQVKAYIVMPGNTSVVKADAVRGYGAEVTFCEATLQARETICHAIMQKTGAVFIPPYDHWDIIAGAGTAAMELLEDAGGLEIVLAPVGGGGLLSGTALAFSYFHPATVIIGAEPKGADDAARSLASGKRVESHLPQTIADGLLTTLGEKNFSVIRRLVTDIVTVDESSIVHAMRWVWERMKIVIEPSSAVPVAVLLDGKINSRKKRIGVIISGGNVDMYRLPWLKR